ncbi:MAG: phenylalanine--tRNA ligase beta subunit-related protein [Oscillospiraceae bacterium]
MRERLRASGIRPINNIVDITNYVMLEYGQPMHAFDIQCVEGGHLVVRNAVKGESITTLDGTTHALSPDMLVIADAAKPSAVAGVMGGADSGIHDNTVTVVFESANFFGSRVRTTARKLGMRTEASSRFEKGLDPEICARAANRACELVELLACGDVIDGIIDVNHAQRPSLQLPLDADWINRFLGISVSREDMISMLIPLGFSACEKGLTVPTWRADIEHHRLQHGCRILRG